MEESCFDILDVENLRPHYARTCAIWADRLAEREDEAIALVGERTFRIWKLYLAASSVAFEEGSIYLHQTLASCTGAHATDRPTTREEIYQDWPRRARAVGGQA